MTAEFNAQRDACQQLLMRRLITPAEYECRMLVIDWDEAAWEKRMDNARDVMAEQAREGKD
jgi:hypothetical protein